MTCSVAQLHMTLYDPMKSLGSDHRILWQEYKKILLQGIFLNQERSRGSNLSLLRLLHYRWILYCWPTGKPINQLCLYIFRKCLKEYMCSVVSDSATSWTVARQAPLSMGFSRQEYWSGLPFPSPEDLPDSGIEPRSPTLQTDSLPFESPYTELFFYKLLWLLGFKWVLLASFWYSTFLISLQWVFCF